MKRARPIIAIDGPAGSGKSTVARRLAKDLDFTYLNTGAMYRAVAIAFKEAGITSGDPDLEARITRILKSIKIEFDGEKVLLNGRDVTSDITRPDISDLASTFSMLTPVRERMRELQRAIGEQGGVVMEGRDIGTVVFPDAECKFYFDATPEVRADRRYAELTATGATVNRNEVLSELIERDRRDSQRAHAPLRRADDAVIIDTSKLTIEQALSALKERIQGVYVRIRP
ncbi:MAG TPA: (d)CMP kinase [Candidatus Binataceae bacterium]|nr:(d)CMP kinase [Candidatus Binataceae bacterium]